MSLLATKRALFLGVILILMSLSCDSPFAPDEGELRGAVLDDLRNPVQGATVVTEPGAKTSTTDAHGEFVFGSLAARKYTLTASKAGYEDKSVAATLSKTSGLSCAEPEARTEIGGLSLSGWISYGAGQLEQAVAEFEDAIAADPSCKDAQNGLGWTHARLDSLQEAAAAFQAALDEDSEFLDAHAGMAIVKSALNEHEAVITSVNAILDEAGDGYVFIRDPGVTAQVLRLVLAESHFHLGEYARVQEQIDILDPANGLDSNEPTSWVVDGVQYSTYEEALLAELDLLGS